MPNVVLLIACFVLGVLMHRLGRFPDNASSVLNAVIINLSLPALTLLYGKLGATLAPLALVSVGYTLRLAELRGRLAALFAGLAFALVMGPALVPALFAGALGAGGPPIRVTVFEAAMAPQIGASIVALEHKLDPPLVTLMVGIGIPLSFLTLPLRWYALRGL